MKGKFSNSKSVLLRVMKSFERVNIEGLKKPLYACLSVQGRVKLSEKEGIVY